MAINKELQDIYTNNSVDSVLIETVEISHSLLPETYRFCNFNIDIKATIEDGTRQLFKRAIFTVKHPTFENTGILEYSFNFSIVDFKYVKIINDILNKNTEFIKIKYRLYSSKNFTYPLLDMPIDVSVSDVSINSFQMVLAGQHLMSLSKDIPVYKYNPSVFVGLK